MHFSVLRKSFDQRSCHASKFRRCRMISRISARRSLLTGTSQQLPTICAALGGHSPFFLDVGRLPPEARTSDGQHPVENLFDVCKEKGLRPVPVSAPHRDAAHEDAVATRASANGVCLRLPVDKLLNEDARQVVKSLLARVKITERAKVDIILDLGFILESHVTAIRNGVLSITSVSQSFYSVILRISLSTTCRSTAT